MRSPRNLAVLLCAALTLALAACGDSDESTNAAGVASGGTKAQSAPKPPTSPPENIPITEPLGSAPAKGKTLYWLQCELPICDKIGNGVKAGASALGWNIETLVFKAGNPGGGLKSALQKNPDAIAMTGIPSAAVKPQASVCSITSSRWSLSSISCCVSWPFSW